MRKLLSLITLFIVGLVPIMADDSSGIMIKGDRVSWDAVAAGDRLLLNNATGTLNMAYANCKFASIDDVFLNAVQHVYTTEGEKMDVSAATLSSDNVFVLVEAPEQEEGIPSYYLQHEASKKYIHCEADGQKSYLVEGSNNATSFEVIGALANYEPDGYGSWLTTGKVDDETAVFVHYEGDTKYHFGPFWNYGWTYYGTAQDIIVWNLYRPAYSEKAADKLSALFYQIKAENETFTIGTTPGYYPEDKVTAFEEIYTQVDQYLAEGGNDEAQCLTYYDNLNTAYEAAKNSFIKVTDGYYNFINDYDAYMTYQGVEKAMSATEGMLTWNTYDPKDPTQLFKVTSLGDGTYSIQNVATGEYINTIGGTSSKVPMSAEQTTPQTFTLKTGVAAWGIANTVNTQDYHTNGHESGRGISGEIVTWNGGAGSASAWIIVPVTDQALIDSLSEVGPKQSLVNRYNTVLASAKDMQEKVYDYTALITKGEQMASNALQNGPMSNLIDGNTSTTIHSTWDATVMKSELGEGNGWHNLQITLDEPVNELFFRFTGRVGTTFHDTPNNIGVYVTNNDELGASTVAADSTQWVHVTDLTEGFPEDVEGAKYTSPTLKFDDNYKYIRLVVRHTTHQGRDTERTFMNPFSTGVTFNLSEFQMYKPGYTATSEYEVVEGMKAVADNLNTLIDAAPAKISSLNVTAEDIEAMNAAIQAVQAVYINRDSLYTELASAITSAEKVYNDAMGSKESLITDASQLSSNNSSENNDDSSFAHLLDDETHYSHNFHSAWIQASMTNADITADEWEQALSDNGKVFTGHGYHNLQVKLNQPVSNFWFEYIARTGTTYVDNPNDIEVYVTNNDELGASTDQAEIDQWTKLTELTEGFPESEAGAKYTSPVLKLEDGSTFKYVRFVIKNTALAGKEGFNRVFANPDITGITWNVATWRMYNGLDPQRVQYNYNEKMREAVDALKALIDADSSVDKTTLLTNEKQTALKAAADLVLSMYADTTELAQLYSTYKEYVANSEVDADKALGYVDSQEAIEAFDAAINTAKATVDPIQPDKDKIDAAVASMKEAYKTFMTHVGQVDPNKWYTIISGSSREKFIDQPIFLGDVSTGCKLSIGSYPIESSDPQMDPYAVWRFIPVEGQEGQYYIQSLGTGQYFGDYRGQGSDAAPLMSHEKAPYYLPYFGGGKFKMQQVSEAGENPLNCLKTDGTNSIVLNWPSNGDNQQTWMFKAIEDDELALTINWLGNNTIKVMTLPFATKGDNSPMNVLNEGAVKSYAVKAMTTTEEGTTLELKLKQDFEAGEPFIMVLNDYTQYGEGEAQQPISFFLPETVTDTSAIVTNGLVGTLQGVTVAKPGMGIFVDAKLKASEANQFIAGRGGYIDPKLVVNEEGDADLIITTTESITGVKSTVVINPTDKVNVYTIDGKLIKRNVKATDAQKSLKKGIYIVGKKKVAVK